MDVPKLKKLRGYSKASLTRILNVCETLTSKYEVVVRLERLSTIFEEFNKYDSQLPEELSEIEEFENKFFETKVLLKKALDRFEQASSETASSVSQAHGSTNFKLPRLNIPSFSGKFRDWPSFKDLFCSLVHDNVSLSKIQKFSYLKGLLTEEPSSIIRHIHLADSTYDEAWGKLLQRYDNKKLIVNSLIKLFLDQPQINNASLLNLRRIADTSDEVTRALKVLDEKASARDPWLIYLLVQKLDPESKKLWSQKTAEEDFPTFDSFIEFLNNRCCSLEIYANCDEKRPQVKQQSQVKVNTVITPKCLSCKGSHNLFKCMKFKALDIGTRKKFVRDHNLCYNCLGNSHQIRNCASNFVCSFCKGKHHTLLHEDYQNPTSSAEAVKSVESDLNKHTSVEAVSIHTAQDIHVALLPTALVNIWDSSGNKQNCRILLDSGSQASFMTDSCVQRLGIQRKHARVAIKGIGSTKAGMSRGCVNVTVCSRFESDNQMIVKAFILNKLTSPLPAEAVDVKELDYVQSVRLADPNFATPQQIDMIIGADYFFSLLRPGQILGSKKDPVAQNTIFGWVLSGKLKMSSNDISSNPTNISSMHMEVDIDKTLKQFWETEEVTGKIKDLSEEEEFCENHFKQNYRIGDDGKFIVKLPFYKAKEMLGDSKSSAMSRLYSMETKFKNDELRTEYKTFMHDYEVMGHMKRIDHEITTSNRVYYLPHHAVIKPSSTTTKLRVVFDASCRTSTDVSLNDLLGIGTTLQRDLFSILLNFRMSEIAFTADIEKMYRQIWVDPEDQNFQRIFWRNDINSKVQEFQLCTVTYGTASAPFLATRALHQVGMDCKKEFPLISKVIKKDFYMDDLLSGSNSLKEAFVTSSQLSETLEARGFHLRKWRSNSPQLLNQITSEVSEDSVMEFLPNSDSKVLGIHWDSSSDTFHFKVVPIITPVLTKRKIISESARVFDPLGLLSPFTVFIKNFYQQLWFEKLEWDTVLPERLEKKWNRFQKEWKHINSIKIPRWLNVFDPNIQLHGFSDASEHAYAAAIYCVQSTKEGRKISNLMVSKTKVAPIKQISIPRLELNGALLLARLFQTVSNALQGYHIKLFAWTDARVVLSWLSSHPRRWKTFVAHRTCEILESIPREYWNHVQSKENPADIASRGISPQQLSESFLWWHGPSWLVKDRSEWPITEPTNNDETPDILEEERSKPIFASYTESSEDILNELFSKFSSLTKIIGIVAYCKKFIKHCKQSKESANHADKSSGVIAPLQFQDRNEALNLIIQRVQNLHFATELKSIRIGKPLPSKSLLQSLNPFIDKDGVLRVGGRLQNSLLSYNAKHPIILPNQHKISILLVKQFHITNLHAGPTLLSNLIKQKFWIIGSKRLIRSLVHKCLVCIRYRSTKPTQLMGNLPEHRVTLNRPFFSTGIDFAGPITIKFNKGRGAKTTKGYVALFVCMATKAVHCEAVSDLSTDAFIAALRRFSSRRGAPRHIYCDNATNFTGARRKLYEIHKFLSSVKTNENVSFYFAQASIEWHMIPPSSPHFGGIWEAAVKSVKYYLLRVIGETLLTFEELATLLTQIEALLNSRPLTPVNPSDISSLDVLTPSHFLIGEAMTSVSEKITVEERSYSSRWDLVQRLKQSFWKHWHQNYLNSLQQRTKWKVPHENLLPGNLVLVREQNTPPGKWPIARVVQTHAGKDGLVRVATIKTARGQFKRPLAKLVKLHCYQD